MTPLRLQLVGFAGVRSGLGRDALTLDLTALPGDAALVAIVGPNGAGKTTVMDNLHPYRLMPSRASGYTPGSFSFWDHVAGPEALRELEWEHDGRHYRTTLLFRNSGKTKKAEAYLHVLEDGRWQPARLADGTVSDGKTDTYDRCVAGILGAPETFFTSAFSAQNRRPLSAYANGEIKALMADLLGIEAIREIGAKATQVVRLLRTGLETLRQSLTGLVSRADSRSAKEEQAAAIAAQRQACVERREAATLRLTQAQAAAAELRARLAADESNQQRRKAIEARRSQIARAQNETLAAIERDAQRETERMAELERGEARAAAADGGQVARYQAEIERLRALVQRKAAIDAAVRQSAAAAEVDRAQQVAADAARTGLARRQALQAQRATLVGRTEGTAREANGIEQLCVRLEKQAGLIDRVPCQGTELQGACPLLTEAMQARAELGPQRERANILREQRAGDATGLATLDEQIGALGDVDAAMAAADRAGRELAEQHRQTAGLAALAPQLAEAEHSIAAAAAQLAHLAQAAQERQEQLARARGAANEALAELDRRKRAAAHDSAAQLSAIEAELVQIQPPFDMARIAGAAAQLAEAQQSLQAADAQLLEFASTEARLRAEIAAILAEAEQVAAGRAKIQRLEVEIAAWTLIGKAFGNDGIVALSIDDAGPTLAGIVNDLLLACYGSRFTVSIETQTSTAKGELREGFDILVHDGERGESKSVSVMSGGERVWINEALTRGIALYAAQNSGQRYGTLFSDESDGPLDPQRKRQFMRMKREVLAIGGYRREFFVSQSPELWELADTVIDVSTL